MLRFLCSQRQTFKIAIHRTPVSNVSSYRLLSNVSKQNNRPFLKLLATSKVEDFHRCLSCAMEQFIVWARNRKPPERSKSKEQTKSKTKVDEKKKEESEFGDLPSSVKEIMKKMEEQMKKAESERASSDDRKKDSKEESPKPSANIVAWIIVGAVLYLFFKSMMSDSEEHNQITWKEFVDKFLTSGRVHKVVHYHALGKAIVQTSDGIFQMSVSDPERFENDVRNIEQKLGIPPPNWIPIETADTGGASLFALVAIVALVGVSVWWLRKNFRASFKIGDTMDQMFDRKITIIDPHAKTGKLKIKFKDVAGLHEAKVEIKEFVDYLKSPARYTSLGAKLPKGALMTGPPGCGKTLLAKALAAESSVPFISMAGSEFIEMIGGMGARRVRNLFKIAKQRAPCIIYIDEIDAVGRKRAESHSSGEEEQTLNQLLVEMDGMGTNKGVVVLGSTNRPDILDKALLRPGRFDRHITIDYPTLSERAELFRMYLARIKKENSLGNYTDRLAQMTPRFSGADIRNIVNEAALHAATNDKKCVTLDDVSYAMEKIIAGPEKRSKVLMPEEREIVAYHESGHALVAWLLEHTDALLKVSIVPRTSAALGFAQYSPRDKKLYNKEELFDRMCAMLGGRVAESIIFNRITTGAQNDLEKVTKSAYQQTKIFGMSDVIGPLSFPPSPGAEEYADYVKKPYSKQLQAAMDQEVTKLVSRAYDVTEALLKENKNKLEKLAKTLLEKETLSYEDVKKLIGPPTYGNKHVVDLAEQILPDITPES
ncbi:peptidase family m41 domain-containing protein [Ditylenchus destructor]|nr:peptidase family m41 domain-containing protein [Ditylenchus destructor]